MPVPKHCRDGWIGEEHPELSRNGVGDGLRTRDLLSHSQAFYP